MADMSGIVGPTADATDEPGFDVADGLVVDGWRVRPQPCWRPDCGVWLTATALDEAPVDVLIRSWDGRLGVEKVERQATSGPLAGDVARWAVVNAPRAATELFEHMPRWQLDVAGIIVGGPKRDLRGAAKQRTDDYLIAFAQVAQREDGSDLGVSKRHVQRNLADARKRGLIDDDRKPTDQGARLLAAVAGDPCDDATREQRVFCGRCLLAQ